MNNCFENVTIFKPETSRPANSEKYIVCTNYLDNLSNEQKHHLLLNIDKWKMNENEQVIFKKYKISNELCYDIDKLNKIYIDFQLKSITYILNIITNKLNKNEYHNTLKDQVFNAIDWCEKYQIPINENSIYYKKNN